MDIPSVDMCLTTFPAARFFQGAAQHLSRLPKVLCWADPAFLGTLQDPLSFPNLWLVPPPATGPSLSASNGVLLPTSLPP